MRPILQILCLWLIVIIGGFPVGAQATPTPFPRPDWNGQSRFTVLVLGLDRRPGEENSLAYRSDVMMVVSVNPANRRIGILSIPRDTHIALPQSGDLVPVNTLLVRGEAVQAGYGPVFAMEALQYNLGMYIDSYVLFDFEAFAAIVDLLGGIEVDVPAPINDPLFPDMDFGYDPFSIRAGRQTLDGDTALKYVRTRHGDNDFLRGQRQLQVIEAIRQSALQPGTLAGLVAQVSFLLDDDLRGHVYSDLTVDEIIRLAQFGVSVTDDHIAVGALDQRYSLIYAAVAATSIRVPDRAKLAELMTATFGERYWE